MGRPTIFTTELAASICARIAEGESLRSICRDDAMPALSTVFKWIANDSQFTEQYARAKDESADAHADKITDVADRTLSGEFDPAAARVAIDAMKWTASKLKPRKYGDKLELSGDKDAPLTVQVVRLGPDGK